MADLGDLIVMPSPLLTVLQNRPFRNLWFAQIASQLSVNMMASVLMIRVYEQTHSNTAVSFLVLAIGLPALLLGSVAGVYVDRLEKRMVLLWCNILRGILLSSLFLLRETLFVVYFIAVVISIITQFFIPAEAPLIPSFIPNRLLLTANSLFSFTFYATVAIGFVSSGPLLYLLGSEYIFLLMGGLLFLASIFAFRIPPPTNHIPTRISFNLPFSTVFKELREGIAYLFEHRSVLEAMLLFTASQAFLTTIAALSPGFADRVLLINLTEASVVIMGPAVIGLIVGSLLLPLTEKKINPSRLITLGIFTAGITLIILSIFVRIGTRPELLARMERIVPPSLQIERVEVAVALFFLLGLANAAIIVPLNARIQKDTIDSVRGRIYGVLSALTGGISILPVIGAGTLADAIGVGKTLFALSIIVLSFAIYRSWKK